ncbi:MAG TPA: type II toxin-antitoxin system RelE/ParE family toxin [Thermoanaerobaculia bacterium]|nr:type II toxin-antitoxin system RelE/ParE family toxin [Thermoanaerobaculia bacterium]
MSLILRAAVERDLDEAASWYEERQPGLREAFLEVVEDTLKRIEENPRLYPVLRLDIRRASLRRFPYGIYYALIEGDIHVLAVVHDARHPSVWYRRR